MPETECQGRSKEAGMVCLREAAAHLGHTEYMEAFKLDGEGGWDPKNTKYCAN